ncbi:conserved hypothetical protein [Candidatus Riesia pediculicola USDA]|uniref:Uncharacterized protein n=1 Tax=Riesia pediculicola (strain USDA) TaxID=515618 RepID=D4G7V4_RIEPU|nr:conserved hypothetical protein [Candidatus Riesia pediculicola USDA]ARC53671.1 hypothetical protein AOE55_00670 [Candidatus Riesia pediculicola]
MKCIEIFKSDKIKRSEDNFERGRFFSKMFFKKNREYFCRLNFLKNKIIKTSLKRISSKDLYNYLYCNRIYRNERNFLKNF